MFLNLGESDWRHKKRHWQPVLDSQCESSLKVNNMKFIWFVLLNVIHINVNAGGKLQIPLGVIECSISDAKKVSDESGELIESKIKTAYIGGKILLNTIDGSLISKAVPHSGYTQQIIDDGQSLGQWLKILYVKPLSNQRKEAFMSTMTVSYGSKMRLMFFYTDGHVVLSGFCK